MSLTIHKTRRIGLLALCCATAVLVGFAPKARGAEDTVKETKVPLVSAKEVGEVDIRGVLPLSAAQRAALGRLVAVDPDAEALLAKREAEARRLLDRMPRPLAVIHYEGLVNTDPRRIAAVEHLEDMDAAAELLEVWQATGKDEYARQCRAYVRAWAETYRPTGNDVNENKLQPLFTIYEAMRAEFSTEEGAKIDGWMVEIAEKQIKEGEHEARNSNRHTKRLRIVASIGLALGRTEWLEYAWTGFREFVGEHLYADGTSFDLHYRDTLTYHTSALRPLVEIAVLGARSGENLYAWSSPKGSSLKKSVDYVLPYARGEKQRREWENSKVELDRRRAAAGLKEYQPGSLYEPKNALTLLEESSYFDPALLPVVARLSGATTRRFPTWRTVLNAACSPAAPSAGATTPAP